MDEVGLILEIQTAHMKPLGYLNFIMYIRVGPNIDVAICIFLTSFPLLCRLSGANPDEWLNMELNNDALNKGQAHWGSFPRWSN